MKTVTTQLNPEHVERLNSIAKLEADGFGGMDASLAKSLVEYGLAWRNLGTETLFVYRHPSIANRFDRCTIANGVHKAQEWNWADWKAVACFIGCDEAELLSASLPVVVEALFNYYGPEEVFGSSYWEGFAIAAQ